MVPDSALNHNHIQFPAEMFWLLNVVTTSPVVVLVEVEPAVTTFVGVVAARLELDRT